MYPTLCLHPLFLRYQQRSAGGNAAAACPVPRQGPQQPLHGAVSPGDDPAGRGRLRSLPWVWCSRGVTLPPGRAGGPRHCPPLSHVLSLPHQGLTHLGKGTLTLCPYHSDRQLMSQVAVAGLLTVLVSFLDVRNSEYCGLTPTPRHPSAPRCGHRSAPLLLSLPSSHPGQVPLRPLRAGRCHAAPHAGHLRRGAATSARVGSGRTGKGQPEPGRGCSSVPASPWPFTLLFSRRRWTWWARQASPKPSLASRLTRRRCCWHMESGQSWPLRSTCP